MQPLFRNLAWGNLDPINQKREYVIGFGIHGDDKYKQEMRIDAYSLEEAEEEAKEFLLDCVFSFAEECEEPEEPDRPVVM